MRSREEIPYEEVYRALNKARVDYVVCGGSAVVMFGFARLTIDLDLIVSLDEKNLEKLYDVLLKLGYKTRVPIKKNEFIRKETLARLAKEKNMKVMSFYDPKDAFKTVDVGVNLPNVSQILKRKKFIKAGRLKIPLIFMNDLIKMKAALARPKDIIDVENLKKIKQNEKKR
ncbi:MAG: nucleotidyltransferase [Candidatus Nealsonbacteria bacterium]|nr:nucleotidyltransferase [Candidatus Nealsonbacteria bacterium]